MARALPLLEQAARDEGRQGGGPPPGSGCARVARYWPAELHGKPVEAELAVTVRFSQKR